MCACVHAVGFMLHMCACVHDDKLGLGPSSRLTN